MEGGGMRPILRANILSKTCYFSSSLYCCSSLFNDASSVNQILRRRKKGWYVNVNLKWCERTRSWSSLRYFQALACRDWEKPRKTSDKIVGLRHKFEPGTSRIRSRNDNVCSLCTCVYVCKYAWIYVCRPIFSLFNDAFSVTRTISRRMKGW
jgi:hypothetical protein